MTELHLSEERLMSWAEEGRPAAEIDPHVRSCADCSEILNFHLLLNAEMKDRESWLIEEEYRTRRGGRAVADFAARLESEDAAVPSLLLELRERLARDPSANVAAESRFHTGGVVRALQEFVLHHYQVDPFLAERLARVGCAVAEALPDDYYPASAVFDLRGRAWVLHAVTSTNLDRYDEAFEDADRAQRAYERLSDPGTGLAEVNLTRAFLYYRLGRSSESLPLAQSAADEYERRRDMRKYAEAIETAASLLYMMAEYPPALKMYLRNLEAADELRDNEMRARILHNVSLVYRKVGDLDNAGKYLFDALHIWEGLGMKAAVARGRWSIGLLALARADFAAAENVLRAAIDALREVGAEALAADAKVDLAEALLMLGRPQEIETLCREVEECYARLGLSRGRLSAAGFLRNAAADQILRREDIQHVRTYLEQSRERSETDFAPARRN